METLEEAALKLYPKVITDPYNPSEDLNKYERDIFIEGAKWQQEQDKKLYSEEELKDMIVDAINSCTNGVSSHCQDFDEWWFESVKKK